MELAEFKPILATLVLPPAGPLLLALLGVALARRWHRSGLALATAGLALAWVLSLNAVGVFLSRTLVDLPPPISPEALARVQAIVILGGGVEPHAPEYGEPQPSPHTLARLRYGALLARRSGKPLAFSGGVGWSATGMTSPEGPAARRFLETDHGLRLRWLDDRSRDTRENARETAALLKKDGVVRIALVSDAWHLQRAAGHFRAAGLQVTPAPTRFPFPVDRALLEWLPSSQGLATSRLVLKEWLGHWFDRPQP